jgi:serine/threonine protein phosphatase 1
MDNRYYCIPDLHGCSKLLTNALDFIYKENPGGGKVIFLGDYIDRGPDNTGVLKTVMNPPANWEFVCLLGNHEQMFLDSYDRGVKFYDVSAAQEIAGYTQNEYVICHQLRTSIDSSIISWMRSLKLCHIEDMNVFAHAFYDDNMKPDYQNPHEILWTRMDDWAEFPNAKQKLYLTHGHTPRKHGPIKSPNRVNLDCGAVFYDRLVIAEYYKDVQGPTNFHEFTYK